MGPKRLLARISGGDLANVRFSDALRLAEALGFELVRRSGSHYALRHPAVVELLNLQEANGQAKPYQLRQLLRLLARYALTLEKR